MIKSALLVVLSGLVGAGTGLLAAHLVHFPSDPPPPPADFAKVHSASPAETCSAVRRLTSQRNQLERKLDEVTGRACPAPAELRRRLDELQRATMLARSKVELRLAAAAHALPGEPIPWPPDLADKFKEAAARDATVAFTAELGLVDAQVVVDCAEYPCVASAIVDHATPKAMAELNAALGGKKNGAPSTARAFASYADEGGVAVFLRAHGANHDGQRFGEYQAIVSAVFRPAGVPAPGDESRRTIMRLNGAEDLPRPKGERQ